MNLELVKTENADPISSEILTATQKMFGMVPNLYAGMANNPALLQGYVSAYTAFRENGGFNPQEQEVIMLSVAFENNCSYCMAGHSFGADHFSKVPTEITDAIRNNTSIPDKKLAALSRFTRLVVSTRGNQTEREVTDFLDAGYSEKHVLGVIAAIAVKTMSTYFNHFFKTPLDDAFESRRWESVEA